MYLPTAHCPRDPFFQKLCLSWPPRWLRSAEEGALHTTLQPKDQDGQRGPSKAFISSSLRTGRPVFTCPYRYHLTISLLLFLDHPGISTDSGRGPG